MRKILTIVIMTACTGTAFAAFSDSDAGTAAVPFLKLGAGARASALGGSYTAAADDATSIYWNPAGLARVERSALTVMHAVWFESMYYDWASYARKMQGVGTVGVGIQYFSYGSLNRMDEDGAEGDSFTPSDACVSLSFARNVSGIGLGANLKYISSKITNTASAFALDLGAQCPLMDKRLMLGLAAQNMGTKLKFIDSEDSLPFNVRFGGAYRVTDRWLATLDVNATIDNDPYYSAGTEYALPVSAGISAAARLGYTTLTRNTGGTNGITAGLGVAYRGYGIDYAFAPYGDLGQTHLISLNVAF